MAWELAVLQPAWKFCSQTMVLMLETYSICGEVEVKVGSFIKIEEMPGI